jgi:hypothetical protein
VLPLVLLPLAALGLVEDVRDVEFVCTQHFSLHPVFEDLDERRKCGTTRRAVLQFLEQQQQPQADKQVLQQKDEEREPNFRFMYCRISLQQVVTTAKLRAQRQFFIQVM